MTITPILDHIVTHVPYAHLTTSPPWISSNFTIVPSGRPDDNKIEDRLIIFADGSYIQLIAFIDDDPARMEGHRWGNKGYGIVDYAFTLAEGLGAMDGVRDRVAGVEGVDNRWIPKSLQSRTRLNVDGEWIVWQVSFPSSSVRGVVPFWVFDVTPRERRFTKGSEWTRHACGATGVLELGVCVGGEEGGLLEEFLKAVPLSRLERGGFGVMPHAKAPGVEESVLCVRRDGRDIGERNLLADLRLATTSMQADESISDEVDIRLTRVQEG